MLHDLNRNGKLEENVKYRLRILLVVPDEKRIGEDNEEEGRYPVLKILFGGGPDGRDFHEVWTVQLIPVGELIFGLQTRFRGWMS